LVKAGEIDFGLALASLVPRDLEAIPWQPVDTVLLARWAIPSPMGGGHLAADRRLSLIVPPRVTNPATGAFLEEQFRKLGLAFRIILESSQRGAERPLCGNGPGARCLPPWPGLPPERFAAAFIPLGHYFKPDHLALVRRRDRQLTPTSRLY